MYRIRPVLETDLEAIYSFALQGGLGLTSLPKNKEHLRSLIQNGAKTFTQEVKDPFYLFVLENEETSEIVGTSAIHGKTSNLNYYKMDKIPLLPLFPEVPAFVVSLTRVDYEIGPSEICGLFLTSNARKEGLGKLLSFSRFHFIAAHLNRFTKEIFAILRGVVDDSGYSPFWDSVGRHFFHVDFKGLMDVRDIDEHAAIKLMPKFPLYFELLPGVAQDVLGNPHPDGKPALEMLLEQGFRKTGEVDIYEGGPRVMADVVNILTIQESKTFQIQSIVEDILQEPVLVSNERLFFHACFGKVDPKIQAIDQKTALSLDVKIGDQIRWSP